MSSADSGAATLTLDGATVALESEAGLHRTAALSLDAGRLIPITLTVQQAGATVRLSWQFADRPWQEVPARQLYQRSVIADLRTGYLRFGKAVALAGALQLNATELSYLARAAELRIDGQGWLNALPVTGSAAASVPLRTVLLALLDFAVLHAALGPGADLVTVLRDPAGTLPDGSPVLLAVTGWQQAQLDGLLAWLGLARADLGQPAALRRVYDGYQLLTRFGISVASLVAAITNDPDAAAVQTLQSALRARSGDSAWLDVIRSVNDPVRQRRRDALVAFILSQLRNDPSRAHIDTPDKLFEYFLMDVQMEPCMQTSRVRHAISAVQLFVERVLMNLEQEVTPSAISGQQWDWMKHYRLWEANRQVFLWPENWLEPELRDNQSPFFRQTMSELLQSDITEEAAAASLLTYLSSLEQVAKLEPCSIQYVEGQPGTGDDIAHVVARTPGAERRYYYRRREFGIWTPWEDISLDIEDNPITPVVWKGRLLLFWLKIIHSGAPAQQGSASDNTPLTDLTLGQVRGDSANNGKLIPQAALCWSEYYNGRWQPPKTSRISAPTSFGHSFDSTGEGAFARDQLVLGQTTESDALRLRIWGQGNGSSFLLFNTHGLPQRQEDREAAPLDIEHSAQFIRDLMLTGDTLTIQYRDQFTVASRDVITRKEEGPFQLIAPFPVAYLPGEAQQSLVQNPWETPFFFTDTRHAFFVTTMRLVQTHADSIGFGVSLARPGASGIAPLTVRSPVRTGNGNITNLINTNADVPFGAGTISAEGRSAPVTPESRRTRTRSGGRDG